MNTIWITKRDTAVPGSDPGMGDPEGSGCMSHGRLPPPPTWAVPFGHTVNAARGPRLPGGCSKLVVPAGASPAFRAFPIVDDKRLP